MSVDYISPVSDKERRKDTTSLTFRLEQGSVNKLRDEAQKQGVSINSLVSQIINNFFDWHIFEQQVGFVPILKPVVRELYTSMSKEKILQIVANTTSEESENSIYFMKGRLDLESFLSWFESRMRNSSIQLNHTFDNKSRLHTYVVKHDICENWSLYLKHLIEHIFNEVLEKKVEVSTSFSMLTFRFKQED
ncbi:MAG TPA: hypothetical protein VJ729_12035 [Nitrososphaeraceae archaeon]|nr:hypothetical protein [Nitrososphaeraceae archaeon]